MDYCKIKNNYTSSIPVTSTTSHLDPHEISTEASIIVVKSDDIMIYDHGKFCPVNPKWQKEKGK